MVEDPSEPGGDADPVLPKLNRSSPRKTKKLPKQVAAFLAENPDSATASFPTAVSVLHREDDQNPYVRSMGSISNLDTSTATTVGNDAVRDHSTDEDRDPQLVLAEIAFSAFGRPWPGRNGPRNARMLAGLLRHASQWKGLTVVTGLRGFGLTVGLTDFRTIHDALADLAEEGHVGFVLGEKERYGEDLVVEEPGKPSRITLRPRITPTGSVDPKLLPSPTIDIFREHDEQFGSAGWFLLTRIFMATLDDNPCWPSSPLLGVVELMDLTGMARSRVERLMTKMVKLTAGVEKEGHKYRFWMVRDDDGVTSYFNRNNFSQNKHYVHQERLRKDRMRRAEAWKAKQSQPEPPFKKIVVEPANPTPNESWPMRDPSPLTHHPHSAGSWPSRPATDSDGALAT
jgi:hypothetical protein